MSVMRSLRWLAVAAVALVFAGPVSAQQMRERITAEQLTGLLRDKGMEGKVNERGNVIVETNGTKIVFFISGQTLQAYYGVTGTKANVTSVNEWNKTKRFGRAYIDGDGDPCVELDYDLEGGVTDDNVKVWFDTVTAIIRSFKAHVSK
jgi:Putative bacterial sensory transduction regulator